MRMLALFIVLSLVAISGCCLVEKGSRYDLIGGMMGSGPKYVGPPREVTGQPALQAPPAPEQSPR